MSAVAMNRCPSSREPLWSAGVDDHHIASRADGRPRWLIHTMWMPRSCRCYCMSEASTPYDLVRAVPE
jgi:hypothetical protein